jgi:predicted Zn-dependent protease with MMP-like domain
VGYDPAGNNENVVAFAPSGWAKANGALAVTVLTYDASGAILDADLLVNGGGRFFANFERDESGDGDDAVSIESGAVLDANTPATGTATSRYDLQSVVTHELGHWLGLGEDRDDTRATMYISTRPGEIRKRVLTATDTDVITGLYSEQPASAGQVGCGGRMARGDVPSTRYWLGFGLAVAGLRIFGSRRRRRDRAGAFLMAIGIFLLAMPPDVRAAGSQGATSAGDAEVQIVGTVPRWSQGILQTELTFHVTTCRVGRCPESDQRVSVAGGTLGGVTQIVGPFAVPQVGASVMVSLRDGRGLLKILNPLFKP